MVAVFDPTVNDENVKALPEVTADPLTVAVAFALAIVGVMVSEVTE